MTKAEQIHKSKLAEAGCMICRTFGITDSPVELHHLRSGGWGKGDYTTLIPLCPEHHRGNDSIHGARKAFQMRYGSELDLLPQTNAEVAR